MEPWGDPWAENVDESSSQQQQLPKSEEVEPESQKPTNSPSQRQAVLTGFLDDAQWGSVEPENAWGEWTSDVKGFDEKQPTPELPVPAAVDRGWDRSEEEEDKSEELQNEVSVASESETTVHADDAGDEERSTMKPDDDLSTRTSLSPSEASHTEAATESPRTSFEEERLAGKAPGGRVSHVHETEEPGQKSSEDNVSGEAPVEGTPTTAARTSYSQPEHTQIPSLSARPGSIDPALFAQLFPPSEASKELPPVPDDPISTISARKVWYRLTRKETMREFNSGANDNDYVRVTWATSQTRVEAAKIVSGWASDDRLSGRGPGRLSFYWDQPAGGHNRGPTTHLRKTSIASNSSATAPTKLETQAASTNAPAAFNWSSPTSASSAHPPPWNDKAQTTPNAPVVPAARLTSLRTSLESNNRRMSLDTPVFKSPGVKHQKGSSLAFPPTTTSPLAPTPPANDDELLRIKDLKKEPPAPKAKPDLEPISLTNPEEDDDEWGEMVESPPLQPPTSFALGTHAPASTPAAKLIRPVVPPVYPSTQPLPPLSKDASPIVRLQGKLSPTSTVFGPKPLVVGAEARMPVGPQLLKATKKKQDVAGQTRSASAPISSLDEVLDTKPARSGSSDNVHSALTSSPVATIPTSDGQKQAKNLSTSSLPILNASSETPTAPPQPSQTSTDPWQDADFSIFESAAPQHPPQAPTPQPSDPMSPGIWDMPTPSFTTSNSTQRQQGAENEILRNIVQGLPDLRYMLLD